MEEKNKKIKTIEIIENICGMTKEEVENNLGAISKVAL